MSITIDRTPDELIAFAREAARTGGDYGAALLFTYMFAGKVVCDHSADERAPWFCFNGTVWEADVNNNILSLVLHNVAQVFADTVGSLRPEMQAALDAMEAEGGPKNASAATKAVADARLAEFKRISRLADELRDVRKAKAVLTAAASLPGMGVSGGEWDRDPWLVAVQNGVIDLRTGTLRPGRPEDRITKIAPVAYDPNATCPTIERFFNDIFDRPEKQEIICFAWRLLGYLMTGEIREHILPIWWGEAGRNGKGTLLRLLEKTLGPYIGAATKAVVLKSERQRQSGAPDADVYGLMGKRGVFVSETNRGDALDPGMVKMLTGGDTIVARPPYGRRNVEFAPSHKVVLLTNHRPYMPADDEALWKRVVYVPFTLHFCDDPQKENERKIDHSVESAMHQEVSGFLNMLIRGCLEWQRDGLQVPSCLRQANNEARSKDDTLGRWLDEVAYIGEDARWSVKSAYESYREWLKDNGHKDTTSATFAELMEKRGFTKRKSSTILWCGVGPRDDAAARKVEPLEVLRHAMAGRFDSAIALATRLAPDDRKDVEAAISHIRFSVNLKPEPAF